MVVTVTKPRIKFSALTANDSDTNAMLKAHAYLAITDGFVYVTAIPLPQYSSLNGYVGNTNDPAGAGLLIQVDAININNQNVSINFSVRRGEYFEVTTTGTPNIYWRSVGVLRNPVDQD